MTGAEIREAVERLVEVGAKATPGEWAQMDGYRRMVAPADQKHRSIGGSVDPRRDAEEFAQPIAEVLRSEPFEGFEHRRTDVQQARNDAAFIAAAGSARPALSAIAGKVWLDVEDAKLAESALLSMGARWEFDPEGALPIAAKAAYEAADRLAREVAALAAAEAELAKVEARR